MPGEDVTQGIAETVAIDPVVDREGDVWRVVQGAHGRHILEPAHPIPKVADVARGIVGGLDADREGHNPL